MSLTPPPDLQLADAGLWRCEAFLDGRWQPGARRFPVHAPADGRRLAEVAALDEADARAAVAAAEAAWPAWRARSAKDRGARLRAWHDAIVAATEDLARLMTAEQGKPLAEARAEVAYGASFVEWFAEEARRVQGEILPAPDPAKRILVLKQPVGVCAAITPWNFPLAMITRKVAPALAAGCPVVIKPAEQTPLTALALAELARRAGFPPGVLNVLTADGPGSVAIGRALCAHPAVRHLSFTGSTEVGRILAAQCAPTVKKLALELGGNAPFLVFDDADLEAAVEAALAAKYRNAGQTCVCVNRFYAQDGIHEAFVQRLAERAAALPVGPGTREGVLQGPLIDAAALAKVEAHVADALAHGARLLAGGHRVQPADHAGGHYYAPTVLADVTPAMRCTQEETFGPVAPVLRFHTEAEALAAANASEFGLAAYVCTRDLGRAMRVSEGLESGIVGVNTGLISTAEAPFGGIKQSGLGREGSHHGLEEYLEMKYVCLGGLGG